jgi:hypothetical protein
VQQLIVFSAHSRVPPLLFLFFFVSIENSLLEMKFDEHVNVLVYNLFFFRIQIGTRKKLESILRQKKWANP